MAKNYNYFKDPAALLSMGFIVVITALFAIFYSPWCLMAIPAFAVLFYAFRNNP